MLSSTIRVAFRSCPRRSLGPRAGIRQSLLKRHFMRRSTVDDMMHVHSHPGVPPVRIISPVVWAVSFSGLIYLGCAAYSVYDDVKDYKKRHRTRRTPTLADVDSDSGWLWAPPKSDNAMSPIPLWGGLTPVGKSVFGLVAVNAGVFGASRISPMLNLYLAHTPVFSKNFTMFTSTFAHGGVFHVAFNTYATVMFGLDVGESKTFNGSGSHFLSFYLAAGTLSSLGAHLWTALPRPTFVQMSRFAPGLGASGALMGVLASYMMTNPTRKIGIMFIPGSWECQDFFFGLCAFEGLGMLGMLRWFLPGMGHAAHMAGLGVGYAYTAYDGKKNVWEPARKIAFDSMKRFGLI